MRLAKLVALSALLAACGSSKSAGPVAHGGASGSGGGIATGGATSTTQGSGGASATGGAVSSGGSSGSSATSAGGASGGMTGTITGGTTAGGAGAGGATTAADAGRRDGSAGGSGGSSSEGGAGTGGVVGTGGTRADAGSDARPDAAVDLVRDASADRGGSDAATSDGAACPHVGHVTYTLARNANPTAAEQQAYDLIVPAMDKALYYYNCYTDITKAVSVSYNASVQTADGNINGSIRFGGTQYMEYITAMHEIAHTVGVGTASNWRSFVAIPSGGTSGPWTGSNANAELRAITGKSTDTLTADTQHFWPYGLNYTSEVKSEADVIDHCRIVVAIRKDLGM